MLERSDDQEPTKHKDCRTEEVSELGSSDDAQQSSSAHPHDS
jgi:hypothetical protein